MDQRGVVAEALLYCLKSYQTPTGIMKVSHLPARGHSDVQRQYVHGPTMGWVLRQFAQLYCTVRIGEGRKCGCFHPKHLQPNRWNMWTVCLSEAVHVYGEVTQSVIGSGIPWCDKCLVIARPHLC